MNVNEWGILYQFSTGFDMSAYSLLEIVFTKPDGTTLTVSNPQVTAPNVDVVTTEGLFPAKTYAQYRFQNGDVNQAGVWCAKVIYEDSTPQHLISDVAHFTINANTC